VLCRTEFAPSLFPLHEEVANTCLCNKSPQGHIGSEETVSSPPVEPAGYNKIWSCVGSAGVVNPPDLGKVIFNNSIVQLVGLNGASQVNGPATEARIDGETVTATIRYGVVAVEGLYAGYYNPARSFALALRYRSGQGYVVARFIQVTLNDGLESPLLTFDSRLVPPGNEFQQQYSNWQLVPVEFVTCAYYVELTLTGPGGVVVPLYPPGVSALSLLTTLQEG
jgi:hypothetical protein